MILKELERLESDLWDLWAQARQGDAAADERIRPLKEKIYVINGKRYWPSSFELLDKFLSIEYPSSGHGEVEERIFDLLSSLPATGLRIKIRKFYGGGGGGVLNKTPNTGEAFKNLNRFLQNLPTQLTSLVIRICLPEAYDAFPGDTFPCSSLPNLEQVVLEHDASVEMFSSSASQRKNAHCRWKQSIQHSLYYFQRVPKLELFSLKSDIDPSIKLPIFASQCTSLSLIDALDGSHVRTSVYLNPESTFANLERLSIDFPRADQHLDSIQAFWDQWMRAGGISDALKCLVVGVRSELDWVFFRQCCESMTDHTRHPPLRNLQKIHISLLELHDLVGNQEKDRKDDPLRSGCCLSSGLKMLTQLPLIASSLKSIQGVILNARYIEDCNQILAALAQLRNLEYLSLYKVTYGFFERSEAISAIQNKRHFHSSLTQLFESNSLGSLKSLRLDGFWAEEGLFRALSGRKNVNSLTFLDSERWYLTTDNRMDGENVAQDWQEFDHMRYQDPYNIDWKRSWRNLFPRWSLGGQATTFEFDKLVVDRPFLGLTEFRRTMSNFPAVRKLRVNYIYLDGREQAGGLFGVLESMGRLLYWSMAGIKLRGHLDENLDQLNADFDGLIQAHLKRKRRSYLTENNLFDDKTIVPLGLWAKAIEHVDHHLDLEELHFMVRQKCDRIFPSAS